MRTCPHNYSDVEIAMFSRCISVVTAIKLGITSLWRETDFFSFLGTEPHDIHPFPTSIHPHFASITKHPPLPGGYMQQPQPQQPKQQPAAVPGERLSWEQIQQQQLQREQREAQAAQAAHAAHAQREAQVAREQREAVREVEQRLGCGEVW